jgi:hypothetical protein
MFVEEYEDHRDSFEYLSSGIVEGRKAVPQIILNIVGRICKRWRNEYRLYDSSNRYAFRREVADMFRYLADRIEYGGNEEGRRRDAERWLLEGAESSDT